MTQEVDEFLAHYGLPSTEVDDFLEHYGVPGMKWGVRRGSANSEKRLSRKEFRSKVKQEKKDFYDKKASSILKEASKGDVTLIAVKTMDAHPTVVTGKQFVDYVAKGGVFDVRLTDVYARKTAAGPYELNANPNQQYKKPKR